MWGLGLGPRFLVDVHQHNVNSYSQGKGSSQKFVKLLNGYRIAETLVSIKFGKTAPKLISMTNYGIGSHTCVLYVVYDVISIAVWEVPLAFCPAPYTVCIP